MSTALSVLRERSRASEEIRPLMADSLRTKSRILRSSFLRKQESRLFWIPGRVSLARNDDPHTSHSGTAGGLPKDKSNPVLVP